MLPLILPPILYPSFQLIKAELLKTQLWVKLSENSDAQLSGGGETNNWKKLSWSKAARAACWGQTLGQTALRVHAPNCICNQLLWRTATITKYKKESNRLKKYKKPDKVTIVSTQLWTGSELRVESSGSQLEGSRTLGALQPAPHHRHLQHHEAKEVEGVAC